jgi:hypothetical protein
MPCRTCRETGHNVRTCPDLTKVLPTPSSFVVSRRCEWFRCTGMVRMILVESWADGMKQMEGTCPKCFILHSVVIPFLPKDRRKET